jgi:hypothetical protein
MTNWVLFHYKIPPEPSASRVYIWRKLKRIGAILHQDAVWVLPSTPRTREHFQWLAAEIVEMDGEAMLWEAQPALDGQDDSLAEQFLKQVEQAYAEILEQLQAAEPDLEVLSRQYQQTKAKDYFQSETGKRVREMLLTARGGKP